MIDKEIIRALVTDEKIIEKYYGPFNYKSLYLSPFRSDTKPGCVFIKDKKIKFFDNSQNKFYDCFDLASVKLNLGFYDTLVTIMKDFNITDKDLIEYKETYQKTLYSTNKYEISNTNINKTINKKNEISLIKLRKYNEEDDNFWNQYKITKENLKQYNIRPVSKIYIRDDFYRIETCTFDYKKINKNSKLSYVFISPYGDNLNIKIYRPYANKTRENKWVSYFKTDTLFGYEQLSAKGNILIIASSFKDMMMFKHCGYDSICPNNEGVNLNKKAIKHLKKRFKYIIICYDNDKAGKEHGLKQATLNEVYYLNLDICTKDVSDFYVKINNHEEFVENITSQVETFIKLNNEIE